ncbi:hypothetical protein E2C01_008305 [Portunus trituberculatus]|uniref:Uncharacterized protein n=1 Tax=Portunus trituberculatus TaxID=210409 RepID=A0A5B7D2S4_PORTR|nr:hypothetical protein [Portunus trituberculatus]
METGPHEHKGQALTSQNWSRTEINTFDNAQISSFFPLAFGRQSLHAKEEIYTRFAHTFSRFLRNESGGDSVLVWQCWLQCCVAVGVEVLVWGLHFIQGGTLGDLEGSD